MIEHNGCFYNITSTNELGCFLRRFPDVDAEKIISYLKNNAGKHPDGKDIFSSDDDFISYKKTGVTVYSVIYISGVKTVVKGELYSCANGKSYISEGHFPVVFEGCTSLYFLEESNMYHSAEEAKRAEIESLKETIDNLELSIRNIKKM